ncbi:MAG: cell division protein ZapA [Pseudomonadota bacterium]
MSDDISPLKINILNKEYLINCPEEQRSELIKAADYLNSQMQKIKGDGKVVEFDKIAIMAAVNLSYDLMQFTQGDKEQHKTEHHKQLKKLNNKVDDALNQLLQLEI